MFIARVCSQLKKHKVPYAIVGGYAVVLHGVTRGTIDIDLVLKWSEKSLKNASQALKEIGLESRLPVDYDSIFNFRREYIENRNLIAWNFFNPKNPTEQVDIIIDYDLSDDQVKTIKSKYGEIKVLSKKDLIEMKKKSGRPQDIQDVIALGGDVE